ncbi:LOW QUALITY PROTEIN: transient receptor potential cation channel protein painless [Drosophila nasuta]|uniref:LOW QUALITY PROTEIN: transient receptor potential cation channel protein painless n=1 Tax=Drosophila nasuta TaxID=42062 RepID=UPI00295E66E6|nr:LOW QUALITY PROTEIN: transient receptor potential cation channel protein painless [Drosophila nasuta]
MELNRCGFIDPQAQLGLALAKRDIREFYAALEMGAQPNLPDEHNTSIYEKALSTAGCAEFIEACLAHGCNVNYINQKHNKAAISYAADSRDSRNLSVLLSRPGVQVDRKYGQLTPLNSLAKNLKTDNVDEVRACMQSLLQYGASPNLVDQSEMTPLHHVLRNNKINTAKQELVQLFLGQPNLDIDSYRNGQVRQMLQQQYPELPLPPQRDANADGEIDGERLLRQLRDGDESQFEQLLAEHQLNISDKDNLRNLTQELYQPLLVESIKRGKQRSLEAILNTGININKKATGEATAPIELSIIWGNWRALEKLLHHPELKVAPGTSLLNTVISRLEEQPLDDFCDHQRCFELLLASEHVNINEADPSGQVPLHYAAKYRNWKAVQTLLHNGAYIGPKSKFNELPIHDMPAELLEQHFDSCITTNKQKAGSQAFEIIVNFANLMRQEKPGQIPPGTASARHLQDEMTPIAHIAESKELRHLLQHPLISSFLFLKWHRLSVIFYLNFLLYTLFTISIIMHTLLQFHQSEHQALTALFGLFSWIGIIYLIIREVVQFTMAPLQYWCSVTNYMEIALIALAIATCIESNYDKETQRVLAVLTILLVSLEFCLLVGSLPVLAISTHMLMLRAVSSTFLKSFGLYSIFVITFSLCFYILFGKPQEQEQKPGEEEGDFNSFSNPIEALIKTIVMLTGEFDAGDIKFDTLSTYLIFVLFVFFMTIVLFNLLNGLAVSDTQAIKAQAELNGAICRTNTLLRYEQVLTERNGCTGFIVNSEPFRTICQRLLNIYPNYMTVRQISILPNDGNQVLIPKMNVYEMKELSNGNGKTMASFQSLATNAVPEQQKKLLDPPLRLLPCCCSKISNKCSKMDSRTVKLALAVIDQKSTAEQKRQREQLTERRFQLMEQKLEQLLQLLHQERN